MEQGHEPGSFRPALIPAKSCQSSFSTCHLRWQVLRSPPSCLLPSVLAESPCEPALDAVREVARWLCSGRSPTPDSLDPADLAGWATRWGAWPAVERKTNARLPASAARTERKAGFPGRSPYQRQGLRAPPPRSPPSHPSRIHAYRPPAIEEHALLFNLRSMLDQLAFASPSGSSLIFSVTGRHPPSIVLSLSSEHRGRSTVHGRGRCAVVQNPTGGAWGQVQVTPGAALWRVPRSRRRCRAPTRTLGQVMLPILHFRPNCVSNALFQGSPGCRSRAGTSEPPAKLWIQRRQSPGLSNLVVVA